MKVYGVLISDDVISALRRRVMSGEEFTTMELQKIAESMGIPKYLDTSMKLRSGYQYIHRRRLSHALARRVITGSRTFLNKTRTGYILRARSSAG